jgi:hypothetical protein
MQSPLNQTLSSHGHHQILKGGYVHILRNFWTDSIHTVIIMYTWSQPGNSHGIYTHCDSSMQKDVSLYVSKS